MTGWTGLTLAVALAAGLPVASADAAHGAMTAEASVHATDLGARRQARPYHVTHRYAPYAPHYYARPVYYRPYPYSTPAPFVFGFGPWW